MFTPPHLVGDVLVEHHDRGRCLSHTLLSLLPPLLGLLLGLLRGDVVCEGLEDGLDRGDAVGPLRAA